MDQSCGYVALCMVFAEWGSTKENANFVANTVDPWV